MGIYCDHIFPRFFDRVVGHRALNERRAAVLAGVESPVLDVGIGTGLNLDYYPPEIGEISAVDPNPGMEKQLRTKLRTRPLLVNFVRAGAEALPFPDDSFRTVVSTITMCSIPELGSALGEIYRVLRPGGRFLFLEHGLSPDRSVARWQKLLDPLQVRIGCGCRLTVEVEKELRKSAFRIETMRKYYVENAPAVLAYMYEGVAVKAY